MQQQPFLWSDPATHLVRATPDHAVLYFSPAQLHATANTFQSGFDGLVTYAVKANDSSVVLDNLVAAGITTFDVASPAEMHSVRQVFEKAVLHYNNPVRSEAEIAHAVALGVESWSVDDAGELDKLSVVPRSAEIAVRFALPVAGAAYDFGSKFGATPVQAVRLLKRVVAMGFEPSLCFHPGTQCEDPQVWATYINAAAQIVATSGVTIKRLNIGGGFAAHRAGAAPDLKAVFEVISNTVAHAFGATTPTLICEPGRAMVAESFALSTRVKGLRGSNTVFLNDGIYGGLADLRDMTLPDRLSVISPAGEHRSAPARARVVFGPTCDSLDRIPDGLRLPMDTAVGDYVVFDAMGAYSLAMSTAFNGYGLREVICVQSLC
ncbi:MAG: type III PLP-dependent enzyme [Paracoccaceae bacterium]